MTAGPGDGMAAARGRLRASRADREHVIDKLKAAFVQGRLTRDEFDMRLGEAFASRTYAELAALTADLPAGLTGAQPLPLPAGERATQLPGLTARPARRVRRVPAAPRGRNRVPLARLRWVLVIPLLFAGAGAALAHAQRPLYTSTAEVETYFTPADPNAVGPDMVTEKLAVSSEAVLAITSSNLGVPWRVLLHGLSVTVPASSSILQISYSYPVPLVARVRASWIAKAYVQFLTPPKAVSSKHGSSTPAGSKLTAKVITPPSVPKSPSSPDYLPYISAALVVGLGLSVGIAAIVLFCSWPGLVTSASRRQ